MKTPEKSTVYSDHYFTIWDRNNKYDKLAKKHFGRPSQVWVNYSLDVIEAFLKNVNENI